ncbi:thrombospondin-1-like, partial [Ruditapes philippinarum]|uniref:thrombospondin-1-like n=1 Tax=Ruditapes philippinarum TaxID=129788 RepID=UPI00295C2E51
MGCTDNQNCGVIPEVDAVSKLKALPVNECYECCRSLGCNLHLCKHPKPSLCQDDKSMDCAKLNEMFDICKDIHDAKKICPSFCNLCRLVDGNWADWSRWSECDVTCGNGKHTRVRTCTNPAPAYQGLQCYGNGIDSKPCQRQLCPVHGRWSAWSLWSSCPVTCGLGMQKRYRNCSNPYPSRYGDHCFGDPLEYKICFERLCDDGIWGDWEKWGSCSASCDSGIRHRSRSCKNNVGTMCKGSSFELQSCKIQNCPCQSIPTIKNGVLEQQSESPSDITYKAKCNDGYQVSSMIQTVCDKKSGWPDIPTCNKVSCGKPLISLNGQLRFTTGVTFQEIAGFECVGRSVAYGNPTSTCLADGTWSRPLTCLYPVRRCVAKPEYNRNFTNVAFGKNVTLSSSYSAESIGANMVDGNYLTRARTQSGQYPSAIVDLEQIYTIHHINIYENQYRSYLYIQVADNVSSKFINVAHLGEAWTNCTFRFENPVRGRYVRISLGGYFLEIAEMEVY